MLQKVSMKAFAASVMGAAVLLTSVAAKGDLTPIIGGGAQGVSSGSTTRVGATVTYIPVSSNVMNVAFGQGPQPPSIAILKATVVIDSSVTNSLFKGNYISRGANTIRVGVTGSGVKPDGSKLLLQSATRIWTYDFRSQVSETGSVLQTVLVPLTVSGWTALPAVTNADAEFAKDLQAVTGVSIQLAPGFGELLYYPAQSYTISNCAVMNDDSISSKPGEMSNLEQALISRFGYGYGDVSNLTESMKQWDADGDGMPDYVEIWCENDPAYANSIFAVDAIRLLDTGVSLTWTCVKGATYSVLRSAGIDDTFSTVSGLAAMPSEQTGFMTKVDESVSGSSGAYYYRIRKE